MRMWGIQGRPEKVTFEWCGWGQPWQGQGKGRTVWAEESAGGWVPRGPVWINTERLEEQWKITSARKAGHPHPGLEATAIQNPYPRFWSTWWPQKEDLLWPSLYPLLSRHPWAITYPVNTVINYYVKSHHYRRTFEKACHGTLLGNWNNGLFIVIFMIMMKNTRSLTLMNSKVTENSNNDFHFTVKFTLHAIPWELCC